MTRTSLLKKIFSIYKKSVDDQSMRQTNDKLASLLGVFTNTKSKVAEMPALSHLSDETTDRLNNKIDELVELVDSETFPITDQRQDFIKQLAEDYLGEVEEYTQSGGTGFYDAMLRVHVTFDNHVLDIEGIPERCSEKGLDIQLVDKQSMGNPEFKHTRCSAILTFIYPTSQMEELKDAFNELDLGDNVKFYNYFIAPSTYLSPKEQVSYIKALNEELKAESGEQDTIMDAVTMIGLYRVETSDLTKFDPIDAIYMALFDPKLYRNENDHVNGMMPTRACYGEKECFHLGGVTFTEHTPPRMTLFDDVTLYSIFGNKA